MISERLKITGVKYVLFQYYKASIGGRSSVQTNKLVPEGPKATLCMPTINLITTKCKEFVI